MRPNFVQTAPPHHPESSVAWVGFGHSANLHDGDHEGPKHRAVLRAARAAFAQLQHDEEERETLVFNTGASSAQCCEPIQIRNECNECAWLSK